MSGTVVNASAGDAPAANAEVVLRMALAGDIAPYRTTTTDAQGKFLFDGLPIGDLIEYLPGANNDGIHYPGARLRLTIAQPRADVRLAVRECVAEPSPLVVRRMEVDLRHEPGLMIVTEALLIDNPSPRCYVGKPEGDSGSPITLRLAIPSNFVRCTFEKEFFGRRFYAFQGGLVTDVPWQPGQRELKYTYRVPNEERRFTWQRPLDLPCEKVVLTARADPSEVACNLSKRSTQRPGEVVFESAGSCLEAGHTLRVDLGRLPVSWIGYARWTALALVLCIAVGGSALIVRRRGATSS